MLHAKSGLTVVQAGRYSPFLFELVPQLEHFHFDLAFALVLDYPLVGLALAVLEVFDGARVRRGVVAGFEVCAVALHVA